MKRPGRKPTPGLRRQLKPGSVERCVVWLTIPIATRLRVAAARKRMSLSAVVELALDQFLPEDP